MGRGGKEEGRNGLQLRTREAPTPGEGGSLRLYLVTSGAEVGWTCFMMVWIQFRRIPDVIAERVNSPSFVYTKDKAVSVTMVRPPTLRGQSCREDVARRPS